MRAEVARDLDSESAERMRFYPPRWAKVYDHWMANIQDWCISRQLWWGHRVPVWYSEGWIKQGHRMVVARLGGDELHGRNVKELRCSALQWARERGIIGQDFLNLDTGEWIKVHRSSLEHGFSNFGIANVKLVPALPALLRHAQRVSTEPHVPASDDVLRVETYFAALELGDQLFSVKFRVKVFAPNFRLYDHQTVLVSQEKKVEPDGNKSPEGAVPKDTSSRPASGSNPTLAELIAGVNRQDFLVRCQMDSPGETWTQDPDVLDTWFSSWLWPFGAMGWPEKTGTLAKFYPTTDLVTGPDIIFFWVARMIMAGFEFTGEMPFRNVYFTGIIRDKQGRKMSKSLGNSPDPLDLIAKYGADALRFGVMRSAPLGADILFDEKNVELGRNFCTKLWNAVRFRQMQGGESEGEIAPALLTSDDKWILLRLDAAIDEVSLALDEYRFSDAANGLYEFFWSEFCDWYLEASKAALNVAGQPRHANTLAVIDFILGQTLRLMHPFLPFITEELWHGLGFHDDLPADQGGSTIMFARWPKPLDEDFQTHYGLTPGDAAAADAKYETVLLGRGLRRDFKIASNKRVRFVLKPAASLAAHDAEVLKILLHAELLDLDPGYIGPRGTPTALTPLGELFLPLDALVDVAAEQERLGKELGKIEQELAKVRGKLSNETFVSGAPAKVVEEHRQREADWQNKLTQLTAMRDALVE